MTQARPPGSPRPQGRIRTGWSIVMRVQRSFAEDQITLIAAGIAFYALLALFPAITALVALAGLVLDPVAVVGQMEALSDFLPAEVTEIVIGQATDVAGHQGKGLGIAAIIGLGIALYSASKGVGSLIQGLNVAYDVTETRGFIWRKALSILLTLVLILGFIIGIGMSLALPAAFAVLPFDLRAKYVAAGSGALVMLVFALLSLALIYRFGPSRRTPREGVISAGALIACLIWFGASAGFGIYVSNFASYNESFGSLGGIVILLLWLWLSATAVLLGAEVNAALAGHRRERDEETAPPAERAPGT